MKRYSDWLAHYGTPGMKWGVRNYQYYDGTLTPEGVQRYRANKGKGAIGRYVVKDEIRKAQDEYAFFKNDRSLNSAIDTRGTLGGATIDDVTAKILGPDGGRLSDYKKGTEAYIQNGERIVDQLHAKTMQLRVDQINSGNLFPIKYFAHLLTDANEVDKLIDTVNSYAQAHPDMNNQTKFEVITTTMYLKAAKDKLRDSRKDFVEYGPAYESKMKNMTPAERWKYWVENYDSKAAREYRKENNIT